MLSFKSKALSLNEKKKKWASELIPKPHFIPHPSKDRGSSLLFLSSVFWNLWNRGSLTVDKVPYYKPHKKLYLFF